MISSSASGDTNWQVVVLQPDGLSRAVLGVSYSLDINIQRLRQVQLATGHQFEVFKFRRR